MSGTLKWSLPLRSPHQNPVYASPLHQKRYMTRPSHPFPFNHPTNIVWAIEIIKLLIMWFSPFPLTSSLLDPNIFLRTLFSNREIFTGTILTPYDFCLPICTCRRRFSGTSVPTYQKTRRRIIQRTIKSLRWSYIKLNVSILWTVITWHARPHTYMTMYKA